MIKHQSPPQTLLKILINVPNVSIELSHKRRTLTTFKMITLRSEHETIRPYGTRVMNDPVAIAAGVQSKFDVKKGS